MYIGILDDDKDFIKILKSELDKFGEHTYKIFHSMTNDVFEYKFDIFFLDVLIEGKESFDFGEIISSRRPDMTLVYISSMEHFVYDSIYQTSFFFVRKSKIDNDLMKLFEKYNKRVFSETKMIDFVSGSCKYSILQKDIIHIISRKNSVTITTMDKDYIVYKSLKVTYDLLDKNYFYRLNSFTVLNFEHIKVISEKSIILDNEKELFFSRNSKTPFMNAYTIYRRMKLWTGH